MPEQPPPSPDSAGYTLASAHWPDIEAGARRVLVVPVGSLEQHGAHLPLDTDTRIAVAVAQRACAGKDGVGLAPAIAIGASGEHADFPGTLSVGHVALSTLLVELGRHASLHWPTMLLVNGHGGNTGAIGDALGKLRADPEIQPGRDTVADGIAEVHDPLPAERFEHHIVERGAGDQIGALDTHVVNHAAILPPVRSVPLSRPHRPKVDCTIPQPSK